MSIVNSINNHRSTPTTNITDTVLRWQKYKSPNDASELYRHISPTINSAITTFAGGNKDLRVPAYRLAFDAIASFDPSKGTDIKTHVFNNLKRLNRISSDRANIVHVPEGVARDYSMVSKAISNFYDEYNREPTDDELSDITKLSKKRIDKILERSSVVTESGATTEDGADRVSHKGISNDTYIDYIYASSDPIDKKIIEMTAGQRGRRILQGSEVARRLRITPAAVSMRMNKLRDKMIEIRGLI